MIDLQSLTDLIAKTLLWGAMLSAIPLTVSMVVGLCVSTVQAATQIQDQSLTFVPKLFAVLFALWVSGDWIWESFLTLAEESLSIGDDELTRSP